MNLANNKFFTRRNLNLDISHRCPLECLRCQRQMHHRDLGYPVPGEDLSLDDFEKITNYFTSISFCGQLSDPIHHLNFVEFLKMCFRKHIDVNVHTASSHKSEEWYIEAWKANPRALWIFGIDGLPNESHIYRVNQDGEKLFNIMIKSKKYLKRKPQWQFIIFSYNENHINQAREMAKTAEVDFLIKNSGRWWDKNDWLLPTNKKDN